MKAIVFAAGIGSRLKPFTLSHPKALAPVGGRPVLEFVVERLKKAGVTELVINVHHFAGQITDFVKARNNFGITVHISDESAKLLETGGGILKARRWLEGTEPFIVHNADIVSNVNIADMYHQHVASHADVTLLATPRTTSRYLFFDNADNRLKGWCNTRTGQTLPQGFVADGTRYRQLAFDGVHVISPAVLNCLAGAMPADTPFSITPFYVDNAQALNIQAYTPRSKDFLWCDIGTPENLELANKIISEHGTDF